MDYERAEGCKELRKGDVKLFNLLMREKDRYYAIIDNDTILVIDKELELKLESINEDADVGEDIETEEYIEMEENVVVGVFHSSGERFIMAMFEYMNINAEYC